VKKLILYLFLVPIFVFGKHDSEIAKQVILSEIEFNVEILISDSLENYVIKNEDGKIIQAEIKLNNFKNLKIDDAGKYFVYQNQKIVKEIRVLPAWISVLPPLVAIFLALIFKEVLISLFAGIFVGTFFLYDYNLFSAFLRVVDTILIDVIADRDHIFIILFTTLIGGVVGIISANGGTLGLANKIIQWAKTPKSGMLATWFLGVMIFFDDYANSLLVGNMMRPITDKLKISREKLAFIVDSTSAPITSLVIVSTWIGFELGLISEALKITGIQLSSYDVFIQSLPYRFYPIAIIFFVFWNSYSNRDFGPMLIAEKKVRSGNYNFSEITANKISSGKYFEVKSPKWYNSVIPILIILLLTLYGLYYTGVQAIEKLGLTTYSIREIISNSDSYSALLWASFISVFVATFLTIWQKIKKLHAVIDDLWEGLRSMFVAIVILIFAWGISSITAELHTADYLISVLVENVDINFIAVLVFLVSALTSFSTGTSWGTMAIIMPIVVPLTWQMGLSDNLSQNIIQFHLLNVVGSVLAGAVFGDHCSPIADTTILSSLASSCNHIEHVRTQLPYAILVGIASIIFGNFGVLLGLPIWLIYILLFGFLIGFLQIKGEKVN